MVVGELAPEDDAAARRGASGAETPGPKPVEEEGLDRGVDGCTELRVHGVSGTPPEVVLGHPLVRLVSGDRSAGLYRRYYPGGRSADRTGSRRLEAYGWGGLTSGPGARAAWLLLLPFMLVNLAHWMLPAVPAGARGGQRRLGEWSAALLRLLGLSLTLTMVLGAFQVAVDVLGWQCAALPRCVAGNQLARILTTEWIGTPGRRVVVTALVPLAVVVLVGLLGRSVLRRTTAEADEPVPRTDHVALERTTFWAGNPGMPVLRTAHVAGATGLVAALVATPTAKLGAEDLARTAGALLVVAGLAIVAAATVLVAAEPATGRGARSAPLLAARWLQRAAWLLVVVAAAYAWWAATDAPGAGERRLPGLRPAILSVLAVQALLLLLLALAVAVQRPWTQGRGETRVALRGLGAPAVALVSWLVAGGFTAGLTFRVAEVLGRPVLSQQVAAEQLAALETQAADESLPFAARVAAVTAEAPLTVPPSFAWAGLAAAVLAAGVVVVALGLVWSVRSRAVRCASDVVADHLDELGSSDDGARERLVADLAADPRVRAVARAEAVASLGDKAGRIVGWVVGIAGVVLVVSMAVYLFGPEKWELVDRPPLSTLTRIGTWLMGIVVLGLGLLFWNAYRNPQLRRYVGILWDVGTFWPRAAHPMAPPSYGERAVPELADRVEDLTRAPGSVVVLSGHSQGSILVAATVLRLDAGPARQVVLVTHGSPLRRLYARFFPAYLGEDALAHVGAQVGGRWRNLYRRTDPIGSWVLDPEPVPAPAPGEDQRPVDRRLVDPQRLDGHVLGHSDYWDDTAYERVVTTLLASVREA